MRIDRHIAVAVLALATTAASAPEPRAGGAVPQVTNHESPADALGIALEGYPYPWPVHFLPLTIEGQDVRMAYMDVPPAVTSHAASHATSQATADAPCIVLLHGKNFGGYYWADTARALSAAGYRVVIPDQIGWGKSSKPEIRYSFQFLAANTARLLDSLGVAKAAVLGHSTGGMLAVRFALMYPERVSRLILED